MEELLSQLQSHVRGGWKYRWYAIAGAWIFSLIGFGVVFKLPDNFQASARVFVDTQSILKPLLAGMANVPNVEQQVSIMSRTLLSRPNVERVMRMVDLDLNANSDKDRERLVAELTSKIKIGGTAQNDIYTLSYHDKNPKLAKDIVQALLTIFVEGGFGDNKQDASKAITFIDGQIKIYEEKLAAAENSLKDFKLKNMGLLPQDGADSGSKLVQMSESLNQARLDLSEAEQARDSIKRQVSSMELSSKSGNPSAIPHPEIDARIQTLTKNLDALRLQFTEVHPDIISLRRLIAQLEARKIEESKVRSSDADVVTANPVLQQLKISLSVAEAKVASMRARVDEYGMRSSRLRAMSIAAPEIETELAQLNRDYQINKENYQKLVASRESAKLSGDLNATTEMMTFRVIDPPSVPLTPAGPNRIMFLSMVFAAGLAISTAVAVLLSKIRPTFMSLVELLEATGLPILGSISMKWTDKETARRKKSLYMFVLSFSLLLLVFIALVLFVRLKS